MAQPEFEQVLRSAVRLQQIVPEAVLVGGSAAAIHAGHRLSTDNDHVVADLNMRFDLVLEALEQDEGWATNRLTPAKIILGSLDGIETGVRQLIRARPLEIEQHSLESGTTLAVPTADETLRIKAFLVVRRNQTRDYLDVAALCDHLGVGPAAAVLRRIDEYYADQRDSDDGVATQLARQLADPRPSDPAVTQQLDRYKRVDPKWIHWDDIRSVLAAVADAMYEDG